MISVLTFQVEVVNKSNKENTPISGQLCLKMWHDWRAAKLHVTVLRAQDLEQRDGPEKELPQPFVKLYVLPNRKYVQTNKNILSEINIKRYFVFVFSV